jgi:hypothetical protein
MKIWQEMIKLRLKLVNRKKEKENKYAKQELIKQRIGVFKLLQTNSNKNCMLLVQKQAH